MPDDASFAAPVPCNLCGADDCDVLFDHGVAQSARIVKCRHCGLIYANPRGRPVDHEDYEGAEPEGLLQGLETDTGHRFRWRYDKEKFQTRDFDDTFRLLQRLHPDKGHVVEVGSSLGFLLRRFIDDGWQATGVDPWRELPAFTREVQGFDTIPLTLEQAALPSASADVVILLHVIEHVPDPLATLREIWRVLKPGGHMVLETPRYDTVMFKLMGRRERSLRMDGHIYFYTDETLKQSVETVGFKEVEMRHVGRSLSAERFIWNAANILRNPRLTDKATAAARRIGLANLKFHLNLHDMVRIVAEKPKDAAGAGNPMA